MLIDRRSRLLSRLYEALILMLACFFALTSNSFSQEGETVSEQEESRIQDYIRRSKPSIGLVLGSMEVPGDNATGAAGVDFSFELVTPITLGISYVYAGFGEENRRGALLGKIAYNVVNSNLPLVKYGYFGLNGGWVSDTIEVSEGLERTSGSATFGPLVGFDQPLNRHWTLGAEAKYLLTLADGSEDSFIVFGAVKYWY